MKKNPCLDEIWRNGKGKGRKEDFQSSGVREVGIRGR